MILLTGEDNVTNVWISFQTEYDWENIIAVKKLRMKGCET